MIKLIKFCLIQLYIYIYGYFSPLTWGPLLQRSPERKIREGKKGFERKRRNLSRRKIGELRGVVGFKAQSM